MKTDPLPVCRVMVHVMLYNAAVALHHRVLVTRPAQDML